MAVSQATKDALFARAGGRCECQRLSCGHRGKCNKPLGNNWHAHHKTAGGPDNLGNLEALCRPCHVNTGTYGVGGR